MRRTYPNGATRGRRGTGPSVLPAQQGTHTLEAVHLKDRRTRTTRCVLCALLLALLAFSLGAVATTTGQMIVTNTSCAHLVVTRIHLIAGGHLLWTHTVNQTVPIGRLTINFTHPQRPDTVRVEHTIAGHASQTSVPAPGQVAFACGAIEVTLEGGPVSAASITTDKAVYAVGEPIVFSISSPTPCATAFFRVTKPDHTYVDTALPALLPGVTVRVSGTVGPPSGQRTVALYCNHAPVANTTFSVGDPVGMGTLHVTSNPSGAFVFALRGDMVRELGPTPVTAQLPAGTYTVRVRLSGYADVERLVSIQTGGWHPVHVAFDTPQHCTYAISPSSHTFQHAGGSFAVAVSSPPGCAWSATSPCDWVTVNPTSGIGPRTVTVSAAPFLGIGQRTCTLTIAGREFAVIQGTPFEPPSDTSRPVLTARITADGRALTSPDVVSASRTAPGTYRIQFDREVADHVMVATSTQSPTEPYTISIFAGPRHAYPRDTVLIYVFDKDGNRADGSFHLAVIGAGDAIPRPAFAASILSDGRALASPNVVSASRTAPGTYRIRFNREVADHVMVATSTQSMTQPHTVSVISGPRYGDPRDTVMVHVFDEDGDKVDGGFALTVIGAGEAIPLPALTARILTDGRAWASPDVLNATRTTHGVYRIRFAQDVADHVVVATSTQSMTEPQTISIIPGPRHGHPSDTLIVYVFDKNGSRVDGSFHLLVVRP